MCNLSKTISMLTEDEISEVFMELLARYRTLFPNWEICVFTIDKNKERNFQIDELIAVMKTMKE